MDRLPGRARRRTSLLANLVRSGYGRAFRAVRDDEIAAQLAGFHVARTQITAFVVSAACAGLAGGLLGRRHLAGRARSLPAQPVGRAAHRRHPRRHRAAWSARSGAPPRWCSSPTWADDASKALSLSANVQANLALAIYGVVLIGVMLAAPGGIQGALRGLAGCSTASGNHDRAALRRARRRRRGHEVNDHAARGGVHGGARAGACGSSDDSGGGGSGSSGGKPTASAPGITATR